MDKKQKLLDHMERNILNVAANIRLRCVMGGDPTGALAKNEDALGELLKDVHELKKLEGIPSNLSIVENNT